MFGFIPKFDKKRQWKSSPTLKQLIPEKTETSDDQCKWVDEVIGTIFEK